ncbi:hypothetical protein VEx25_B0022 [Vibrio antiquarius]|uniref:Uncharacterized protein n=1 Tax=Vibrio antiquarius (strain Ex25) TaxID=150340 RepID=A0ABM9WSY4_VIBAE|nr:hypothetical protein VEx25_B0022 [Vibrio antiquarius]
MSQQERNWYLLVKTKKPQTLGSAVFHSSNFLALSCHLL